MARVLGAGFHKLHWPWREGPLALLWSASGSRGKGYRGGGGKSLSLVPLFATAWTVAYQAPLSMGFSRQEYWNRLPFPSPGDLPNPGIKPRSPAL